MDAMIAHLSPNTLDHTRWAKPHAPPRARSGKIYGIPWRSNKVLEFDPTTKAIALLGAFTATNFTWHGGALTKDGRIIAVPYNSAWILEIGTASPHLPISRRPEAWPAALTIARHLWSLHSVLRGARWGPRSPH